MYICRVWFFGGRGIGRHGSGIMLGFWAYKFRKCEHNLDFANIDSAPNKGFFYDPIAPTQATFFPLTFKKEKNGGSLPKRQRPAQPATVVSSEPQQRSTRDRTTNLLN